MCMPKVKLKGFERKHAALPGPAEKDLLKRVELRFPLIRGSQRIQQTLDTHRLGGKTGRRYRVRTGQAAEFGTLTNKNAGVT